MSELRSQPAPLTKPSEAAPNWHSVVYHVLVSRGLDALEEQTLVPERKIFYQFSARGHDLAQVLLGLELTRPNDAICGYYRSRPALLALGVDPADALGSCMARAGGYSDGRDIGAVFNYPGARGASALPMCGGVGTQFTPTAGWAQALTYRARVLRETECEDAIAVALGGDGSVATNGFWSALTMATTLELPMLFYIEDNGYGLSVPGELQTPGADISANLASFKNLRIFRGDGTEPAECAARIQDAVRFVREQRRPAFLHLRVPRLEGHSFQDTQTYKPESFIKAEWARDPLPKLKSFVVPAHFEAAEWDRLEEKARRAVEDARTNAEGRPVADVARTTRHVFYEGELQVRGGQWGTGYTAPASSAVPRPEGQRINMVTAIRRTLEHELEVNPRVLVFGEDVGPKGGVHAVTLGLQEKFGAERVFDTSLSEEGIIGRAVGMALAGLVPVPEIQFRKYADPATEQLNDCGTMRWRTNNRFAAPIVVRMPIGFFKCGDPWHSMTNEVQYVHAPGWKVAVPSNAEDAVGLLRASLRGNDPVMFFEHRAMLDASSARRPYPGDEFVLPFGRARVAREGGALTIVAWGAMVERCEQAAEESDVEVIDLRTLLPWDRETVLGSVRRTRRCLVVHEDLITGGFGAEVAAVVAQECFLDLDAPVSRLAMPDIPSPHNPALMEWALPSVEAIRAKIAELVQF
jgi:2-oxoisovalerate dehydrogenase E1 component